MNLQTLCTALGRASMLALGLCTTLSAYADPSTIAVAAASATAGSTSTRLSFPLTRSADTDYDVYLRYHTVDGTAVAGIDYTAIANGTKTLAAGAVSSSLPITIAANPSTGTDKTFQILLDSAVGVGPAASFDAQQTFSTGALPLAVTMADLNGNGKLDLIVVNSNDNTVSVLMNTTLPGAATPSFGAQKTFSTGTAPGSVTVADLNGDGLPDLIVTNAGDSTVSVLRNKTVPGAVAPSFAAQLTFATGTNPTSVVVADINGDGLPDLIVTNSGDSTVSVLRNATKPGGVNPNFYAQKTFATGTNPTSVAVADLNGDGLPDLIVANAVSNTVSVLRNRTVPGGVPSFYAQKTFATGVSPSSVTVADVNGDGLPDLIVANSSSNTVSVLLSKTVPGGAPGFYGQETFATGALPESVTTADVNGDGRSDLIVANENDGTVSVLLNTTAPGAATASFATQQTFATGANPISVMSADINGDGHLDLIVANRGDNTVSMLTNAITPNATTLGLAAQQTFATGTNPYSVTVADLNGDGKPDLIVTNGSDSTVSVLLNTTPPGATTPSFAMQQTFATGSGPYSVTTADLNGDGKPDLIVANYNDNTVSVLLNTTPPGATTPSFAMQQTFAAGGLPYPVTTADVNGDGKPDLIVTNGSDSTVSVLLNTTAPGATVPSFATQQTFGTGDSADSVTVADVNGDGHTDLIVANSGDNTISVLLNTTAPGASTPSFAIQQTFGTGSRPYSVTTADVNGDGKPDLIVANYLGDTVSVLFNTTAPGATTPSFAMQQTFATGSRPISVTTADVNGDGHTDLIVTNFDDNTISVLLNTTPPGATTPSFAMQQTFATGSAGPISVTTADVNGDGKPDLIVANYFGDTVSILLNTRYQVTLSPSSVTGTIHNAP